MVAEFPLCGDHSDLQNTAPHAGTCQCEVWERWDVCCRGSGTVGKQAQARPRYSQRSADRRELQTLLEVSATALLVCLTAKICESGKITLKLSTELEQFTAGINSPLCQLPQSGGGAQQK